ncbi:MAG: hypothetical protein V4719_26460 [Planctomycetota bacterium]
MKQKRILAAAIALSLAGLSASGCGRSASEKVLAVEVAVLKAELTKIRAQITAIQDSIVAQQQQVAQQAVAPAAQQQLPVQPATEPIQAPVPVAGVKHRTKRAKLYASVPTVLDDTGETLRERLGIPKEDWEKVYAGFDQRLDPLEWRVRQMQKIVDTLVSTVELAPAE